MCHGSQRLPLELVDQIVELSQYDSKTMQACAFVCRSWNSITRAYIFRRVRLQDGEQLTHFEDIVRQSPEIGYGVRELTFGPFTPRKTYRASMPWVVRIPKVLPGMLTSLRTIHFERLSDAAEYCDAKFFKAFHNFASVTKLVLDDSALNIPTLRAFACSLPHLEELIILGLVPLMVNVWVSPPLVSRPRFTSLTIDFAVMPSTTMADFIEWLLRSEARFTVRSLDLTVKVLDTKSVNLLLARVGPNLEHLGLKLQHLLGSLWEYDLIKSAISIRPCRKLQSLSLQPICPAMVAFLTEVPTEHLHTVTFHVPVSEGFNPDRPDGFDVLASEIESERFRRLQAVRFVHDGSIPLCDLRIGLQNAFETLSARDVLRVVEN